MLYSGLKNIAALEDRGGREGGKKKGGGREREGEEMKMGERRRDRVKELIMKP